MFKEKIGISRDLLAQIERYKSLPSIETIISIVNNFNIRYEWLLEGKGEMVEVEDKYKGDSNEKIKELEVKIKVLEDFIKESIQAMMGKIK